MKGKNKYISNLDLKLLGAKFITVPDSHLEMNSNLTDMRKSRAHQLPYIIRCSYDYEQSTLKDSLADCQAGTSELNLLLSRQRRSEKNRKGGSTDVEPYSQIEQRQISKYRSLINRIKQDNDILHRQITNLYKEKKLCETGPKTKPIKQISTLNEEPPQNHRHVKLRPEGHQYHRIYQTLSSQDNPYRKQTLELQKKLSSTNLHKHFQHFLQSHSRRVPEFIKEMR